MTDEQLMILVKKGQVEVLGQLYERYKRVLYSYFIRITTDQQLSQDLTQNVFERVLRYKQSFKDDMNVKNWLFQIARNVRTDHFRSKKLPIDYGIEIQALAHLIQPDKIDYQEQMSKVEYALQLLKPSYKEILLLSWYEKLSYQDIAETLEISESNVKVRIHRAIGQLRTILKKKSYEHQS